MQSRGALENVAPDTPVRLIWVSVGFINDT